MNNSTAYGNPGFHRPPDIKELKLAIFILTFVFGMVGNCLVVCVVIGKKKQRTVSDLLVISLAVSDMLYLLLNIPVNIQNHLQGLVINNVFCKFVLPMMTVTFFLCVFTLTTMAIHRCIGILHPFDKKLSLKQAALVIVVIWIMAIIPVIPLMVVSEAFPEFLSCYEIWKEANHRKAYTLVLFVLQYLLPLLIIFIAYLKISRYLFGSKVPRVFINDIGGLRRRLSREENRPVVRTLAAIVIAYAVCMLPHQLCGILWDFGGHKEKQMVLYMADYTNMLLLIHSCMNPIIYGTLTKHFRNLFARYIFTVSLFCQFSVTSIFLVSTKSKGVLFLVY